MTQITIQSIKEDIQFFDDILTDIDNILGGINENREKCLDASQPDLNTVLRFLLDAKTFAANRRKVTNSDYQRQLEIFEAKKAHGRLESKIQELDEKLRELNELTPKKKK